MSQTPAQKIIRKFKHFFGKYESPKGVIILMYHRINDKLPEHNLVTRTKNFERQMKFLYTHPNTYKVISLYEFEHSYPGIFDQSPKTKVIITFDDGYRDNYLNAFPVLKRFDFPASIFLATGLIGTDKKFARYNHTQDRDMLSWDEIAHMYSNNIAFGAHSVSHPHLPQFSYEAQHQEIAQSHASIDRNLPKGDRLNTFCYPYGEYNTDTFNIIKELGFKYALSVHPGVNKINTPVYELKRIEVSGMDSIKSFEYKLLEKYIPE